MQSINRPNLLYGFNVASRYVFNTTTAFVQSFEYENQSPLVKSEGQMSDITKKAQPLVRLPVTEDYKIPSWLKQASPSEITNGVNMISALMPVLIEGDTTHRTHR